MEAELRSQLLDNARQRTAHKLHVDKNFEVECLVGIWKKQHNLPLEDIEELLEELGLQRIWPQDIPVCSECSRAVERDPIIDRYRCPLHGGSITIQFQSVVPMRARSNLETSQNDSLIKEAIALLDTGAQRQDSVSEQMTDILALANAAGCNDARDLILRFWQQ